MSSEERILRKLLWLRHGCSFSVLYGDDGEMQCNKCGIDFLRDTPQVIESKFTERNRRMLASMGADLISQISNGT